MSNPVFYDGRVHVLAARCSTCIFEPGNRMNLMPGRVREMVEECRREGRHVVCHKTLGPRAAVCRGFWETQPLSPELQIAERLGFIEFEEEGGRSDHDPDHAPPHPA